MRNLAASFRGIFTSKADDDEEKKLKSAASQDDHSGVRSKITLPKPLYRPKWVGSLCAFKALSACMQFLIFENIFLKRDHFENCIFDHFWAKFNLRTNFNFEDLCAYFDVPI